MMLKLFIGKLQNVLGRSLLGPLIERLNADDEDDEEEELEAATVVPDDVKKGHFAVYAIMGEEVKRFIVELGYLQNPEFLRLLEQAEEEFGLRQKRALSLPCRPQELQKILEEPRTWQTSCV